ncbi:probable basic-leucine zipper transcription factor Q [Condylostylus longicornis]|uniref:probable basic-leucine zipper transcription factor Q n=1 Tax=Condylostylus longicornis TaxID=2530218 RepID=UPI00244E3EA6|nr:probable basic-leucine zipper transcription factor Q [Condylostylus longicornis]
MSATLPQQQQQHQIVQNPVSFKTRSTEQYEDNSSDVEDYDAQAQTQIGYRSRLYDYPEDEQQQQQPETQTRQQYQSNLLRKQQQQQQLNYNSNASKKEAQKQQRLKQIEEELEEEEPDRLAILLQKSSFTCNGKTTGYYADDSINCEVFHYCQENQKHSWVCPEGFTFHQIHLICMPPSGENICEQSSKYHVVNEYLYKPLNLQEHQSKPNVTLRYSERYYPENYYDERRYEADDRISHNSREPVQVIVNTQQRKSPTTTASTLPYRFASQHNQHQQQVQQIQQSFRSPEEINISLQQRRPTFYLASSSSTPRYTSIDEDYGYEK